MSVVYCEFRVNGSLSARLLEELDGLHLVRSDSAGSVLCGTLPDQSALIGVIHRIHHEGSIVRGVWSSELGGINPGRHTETVLHGSMPDQAALIDIIDLLHSSAIDLRGWQQLGTVDTPPAATDGRGWDSCGKCHYEVRVAGQLGPISVARLRAAGLRTVPPASPPRPRR